jgi:uncharacterized 2Fe-2S/4Fe-4S cluster protein (DUF4445 family)
MPGAHYKITVKSEDSGTKITANAGEVLLDVLRTNNITVPSPCGGTGTCKKCTVEIEGVGSRMACQYRIEKDITVVLPTLLKAAILDSTSEYSRKISNNAGLEIGSADPCYGIAVDLGTTTVVVYLVDLKRYTLIDTVSFINPQSAYGHDVISRIKQCMDDKANIAQFQKRIVDALTSHVLSLCKKHNITKNWIYKATIVGNTTMLHLLLALDPSSIALAPFQPVFTEAKTLTGKTLGLAMHPKGFVHVLPSLSGYIGADIIAGIASTTLADKGGFTLFIDLGTNGEMALGNKDKLYCCSTAAGPAFEGATIYDGIGAVEGAISEYRDGTYQTIGQKKALGICGSGLVDIVAWLLENRKVDQSGFMADAYLVAERKQTATGKDIVLIPKDIREVQLAKAAIFAGIRFLMQVAVIGYDAIISVYLAGGFGNYINIPNAIKIGLLPKELQSKIQPIGNSAGTGALFALQSIEFDLEIQKVLKIADYIELSMRQDFYDLYTQSIQF